MVRALVVIDVQKYFLNQFTEGLPKKIAALASKKCFDVICFPKFVNSDDSSFVKILGWRKMFDAPDTDLAPELQPFANKENVFPKNTFSALRSKEFCQYLKLKKVNEIYICGCDTEACVYATAMDAFDSGLHVRALVDYCASHQGPKAHEDAVYLMYKSMAAVVLPGINPLAD